MFNVRGVRFYTDDDPFSQAVSVRAAHSEKGVGLWECVLSGNDVCDESTQSQSAGFEDVNGDGLTDRVVFERIDDGPTLAPTQARRSRFRRCTSPCRAAGRDAEYEQRTVPAGSTFTPTADQTQGLRDLTGDGIPDYYYDYHPQGGRRVWIGTGIGFRPPIAIVGGVDFRFSHQNETCDGKQSLTDGGLFDINGDGRPDIVGVVDGNRFVVSLH